jgi:hypothetical protein
VFDLPAETWVQSATDSTHFGAICNARTGFHSATAPHSQSDRTAASTRLRPAPLPPELLLFPSTLSTTVASPYRSVTFALRGHPESALWLSQGSSVGFDQSVMLPAIVAFNLLSIAVEAEA